MLASDSVLDACISCDTIHFPCEAKAKAQEKLCDVLSQVVWGLPDYTPWIPRLVEVFHA